MEHPSKGVNMEELKPCKCGSTDIHEEVMSDNKSHIACQVCGFEIITDYPEWSFEAWNEQRSK